MMRALLLLSFFAHWAQVSADSVSVQSMLDPRCSNAADLLPRPMMLKKSFQRLCRELHPKGRSANSTLLLAAVEAYTALSQGKCAEPALEDIEDGRWNIVQVYARLLPANDFCVSVDQLIEVQAAADRGERRSSRSRALLHTASRWFSPPWSDDQKLSFQLRCRQMHPSLHPNDREVNTTALKRICTSSVIQPPYPAQPTHACRAGARAHILTEVHKHTATDACMQQGWTLVFTTPHPLSNTLHSQYSSQPSPTLHAMLSSPLFRPPPNTAV